MSKLDEIKKALQAATPGPWKALDSCKGILWKYVQTNNGVITDNIRWQDAELIANAPEWLGFLLDELEQTRKESNMLREELHKFQELAIKAANHHKAERDKLIEGLRKLYRIMKTDHDEAHEAEAYDVCDLLEEPLEIVQNILHEIGVTVEWQKSANDMRTTR